MPKQPPRPTVASEPAGGAQAARHPRSQRLLLVLSGFFITNALLAEFIGTKIFSLERTLGFQPMALGILGVENLQFDMTAGVLLWPFVFILTDIVNEYFGRRGVRTLTYLAALLIAYAFAMVFLAIDLVPADFWRLRVIGATTLDQQLAFGALFGQGLWIIFASLVAFLIGQLVDVTVFQHLRRLTGAGKIWLRATGSTLVSQLIDSFVVLYIAFGVGADWPLQRVLAIGLVNYLFKVVAAIGLTPLLYLLHGLIDRYLGNSLAHQLTEEAAVSSAG